MSLKTKLSKAGLVGLTGGVISVIVFGGLRPVPVMGVWLPASVVHAAALAGASVVADAIVPRITPYVSVGSPALTRFDTLVLEPLVLGAAFLAVESLVAPAAELQGRGGTLAEIAGGAAASITASYVATHMNWTDLA